MPDIKWKHSERGGWYYIDEHGNYWHKTANREVITVTTPDGQSGMGWTEQLAWNALADCA